MSEFRVVLFAAISYFVFISICFVFMFCLFIYSRILLSNTISFSELMMFVSFNSNITGVTIGVRTVNPSDGLIVV
jgi:uncharacterized membrane protein YesL